MPLSEKMFLKCFCILFVYLFDFNLCATIKDTSLHKEVFIIRYFEERKIVPVKVELDFKNQTELIQILSPNNSWISISLHDFIEEKKVYKDSNGNQCFITSATLETMEDDREKLRRLNNGIVKGSYIPTFYVLKEIDGKTNITEMYGKRIAHFCKGTLLSVVSKDGIPLNRKKRQAPSKDDKGKFTHHSYGHYGHQSNNYAHYGHDTRITGSVDKDGNIKDQTMTQYQERSQSSQRYPLRGSGNLHQASTMNGRNAFGRPTQNQNVLPSRDSTAGSRGSENSGQFSLQTAQESGYQLNLPFGLRAGNAYRGGISSSGQYDASRGTPYQLSGQRSDLVGSGLERYPSSSAPGFSQASYPGYDITGPQQSLQPGGMPGISYLSPSISRGDQRSVPADTRMQHERTSGKTESMHHYIPSTSDIQQGKIPGQLTRTHTGLDGSRLSPTHDLKISHYQPTLTGHQPGSSTQPGMQYQSRALPDTKITGYQPIAAGYQPSSLPRMVGTGGESIMPDYQPGALPGTLTTSTYPGEPGYRQGTATGGLPVTSVYKPGYPQGSTTKEHTPATFTAYAPGSLPQLGNRPEYFGAGYQDLDQQRLGETPRQHMPQAFDGGSIPTDSRHFGAPGYEIPGMQISQPRYHDGQFLTDHQRMRVSGEGQKSRGVPINRGRLNSVQTQPRSIPIDASQGEQIVSRGFSSEPTPVTGTGVPGYHLRPQIPSIPGYNVQDSTLGGTSGGSRIRQNNLGTGFSAEPVRTSFRSRDVLNERGIGDSASSQTQIQTGAEGTAAEASSVGQYRGVGSKTQVQGGYAGNGSFSAQAQSGFTGGITQSQVQGGKQGGLSGSSAVVENFGSAQSQVQISRPSGSASSTAQGRFSQGMTNVKAQSGRTGGSAGAESQSRGLSSSQVQVDIAGKEVTGNSDFQGTVSASVLGGSSTGQSQTQLQGGYDTGRTYAATAQGGFDASVDYQGSVQMPETSPVIAGQALDGNANIMQTSQLPSSRTLHRPSINGIGSTPTLHSDTGSPISISSPRQVRQDQVQGSRNVPYISQIPSTEHIPRTPSRSDVPLGKDTSQGSYDQGTSEISYPSQSLEHYPNSHFSRIQPRLSLPQESSYPRPLSTVPGSLQTDFGGRAIPFDQSPSTTGGQSPIMQPYPGHIYETPSNLQETLPASYDARQPSQRTTIPQQFGYNPLQQHLPEFSQPTQSIGSQRVHVQPYSPIIRTQNGFPTSDSSTQIGQPLSHLPPYVSGVPNEQLNQFPPKLDKSALSGTGSFDGAHLTSHPQSSFRPGQYQPSLQVPSLSGGLPPDYQGPQLIDRQPTATGVRSSDGTPSITSLQRPESRQPETGPITPQPPAVDRNLSAHQRPIQRPGVREPDSNEEGSCCEALKNLKKRCCGRTSQNQNGSCCSSTRDDIIQDFEDDDLTDGTSNKEPCKIVKAICYIVYKPVGKARICKPTTSNNC